MLKNKSKPIVIRDKSLIEKINTENPKPIEISGHKTQYSKRNNKLKQSINFKPVMKTSRNMTNKDKKVNKSKTQTTSQLKANSRRYASHLTRDQMKSSLMTVCLRKIFNKRRHKLMNNTIVNREYIQINSSQLWSSNSELKIGSIIKISPLKPRFKCGYCKVYYS